MRRASFAVGAICLVASALAAHADDTPARAAEALATVEVRSQVTGTIKTVHFKEGDEVKAGELLFTIDPRPFAAVRPLVAAKYGIH